jgi:hypothetical protein
MFHLGKNLREHAPGVGEARAEHQSYGNAGSRQHGDQPRAFPAMAGSINLADYGERQRGPGYGERQLWRTSAGTGLSRLRAEPTQAKGALAAGKRSLLFSAGEAGPGGHEL